MAERSMLRKSGIAASPGIAIGRAFRLRDDLPALPRSAIEAAEAERELARLRDALDQTRGQIEQLRDATALRMGHDEAQIFAAHLLLLADPDWTEAMASAIRDRLLSAEESVRQAVEQYAALFDAMEDEYMRERANDIRDVGRRVLRNLLGVTGQPLAELREEAVLIARELTPSDTAQLNRLVLGLATETGGSTSHFAIMARSLGLPAVVGAGSLLAEVADGECVIIDGDKGEVIVAPDEQTLAAYRNRLTAHRARREALKALVTAASRTADGLSIELAANIGSPREATHALANGADGIGLFRTEFLFMGRSEPPSEAEQFAAYREVAEAMDGRPVVIRTLDIGGDKDVPFLQLPREANPFLGCRAIRLCLAHTDLFVQQLRAILRASAHGRLMIMFPLISTLEEWRQAKALLDEVKEELEQTGVPFDREIPAGMMVEVPSAALMADEFAREVDFFSVGTNDLTQYTLAVDRMNERIAGWYQPFHPAVLRLIKRVADAAQSHGKWAGMCGEMAGDPLALPLLVGLGLTKLSMSAASILPARKALARIHSGEARRWAEEALRLATADDVRRFLADKLDALHA